MSQQKIAVVIPYRDWGVETLAHVVERHAKAGHRNLVDIVVSDYGSKDPELVLERVTRAGGRVVRTDTNESWSSSAALNLGVLATQTPFCITTDADIIFSEKCLSNIFTQLRKESSTAHLVQCRDIKDDVPFDEIFDLSDAQLEARSLFRPRWGMGGLIAFNREAFDKIGGYDERMRIYGAEDNDFALRLQKSGTRLNWIDDVSTRIYHVRKVELTTEVLGETARRNAIERNREIYKTDSTVVRNVISGNIESRTKPIASIIVTPGKNQAFLNDAVNSALSQSIQNIEVLIDESSAAYLIQRSELGDDPRINYLKAPSKQKGKELWTPLAECQSHYVLFLSGNDVLLPGCLEGHFAALQDGFAGSHGGWIDFDNESGNLTGHTARDLTSCTSIYHMDDFYDGAVFVRTDVLKRVWMPDQNKELGEVAILGLRRAGYRFCHTGQFQVLKRRFNGEDNNEKLMDQLLSYQNAIYGKSPPNDLIQTANHELESKRNPYCQNASRLNVTYSKFLPDHLTQRSAYVAALSETEKQCLEELGLVYGTDDRFEIVSGEVNSMEKISDIKMKHLPKLQEVFSAQIRFETAATRDNSDDKEEIISDLAGRLSQSSYIDAAKITSVLVFMGASFPQDITAETVLAYDIGRSRYWVCLQASGLPVALENIETKGLSVAIFARFLLYPKRVQSQ